jgi:hypothetical protein
MESVHPTYIFVSDGAGNWVPGTSGGGGGGGGPATIANGADVAQGNTADAAGASTVIGQLKAIAAATLENGSITTTLATLGVANAQLLAANANRRYLSIQNNDPLQDMFIRTGAVAATVAYFRIAAGGGYWEPNFAPTDAIQFIGSAAGTANKVVVMEG